jgi:hypothetical protein
MEEGRREFCGKCEVEIERERVIDFTLKNGKRVCEQCFVRETPRPGPIRTTVDSGRGEGTPQLSVASAACKGSG